MRVLIRPHGFTGRVKIPASKSHTIRRLLMASLCDGVSRIERPLDSLDAQSCAAACRVLGAGVDEERDGGGRLTAWTVRGLRGGLPAGLSGGPIPASAESRIDAGNSGTTLFLALAAAALGRTPFTFTGDDQLGRRSAGPLLDALGGLGVSVRSNRGCVPITVRGPWKGGRAAVDCPTSQYLSALLIAAPLAPPGTLTEIDVPLLNEKPYVEMTLSYLDKQGLLAGPARRKAGAGPETGIRYKSDFSYFRIPGGASYKPMNGPVPGDFSSAAFPAAAAVITGNPLVLSGLDMEDTQGDKVFFDYLERMGCTVKTTGAETGNGPDLTVIPPTGRLRGGTFDLNATPDMLPVMAALAVYAGGDTLLTNAAHARLKETDRIAVMAEELGRLGISCEERHDGLLIRGRSSRTPLEGPGENRNPPVLDGRGDHRVVMALACAALGFSGPAEIAGAEAADVTYPGFMELLGAEEYT